MNVVGNLLQLLVRELDEHIVRLVEHERLKFLRELDLGRLGQPAERATILVVVDAHALVNRAIKRGATSSILR